MPTRFTALLGALALAGCAAEIRSALLTQDQDALVSEQCSRPNPPHHQGSWVPAEDDIKHLEEDLPGLDAFAGPDCCGGKRVGDPKAYQRQYFGIVASGKPLIYVNAFLDTVPNKDWKHYAIVICDGGRAAWGAVYDPRERRFSDFSFNGG